ncbi:hypothetical protein KKD84_05030 [Patescibacteria group bacterium]|nr:hypothetical protein [Patescibacteria group bacterium]
MKNDQGDALIEKNRKDKQKIKRKFNFKIFNAASVALIVFLSIYYVTTVNDLIVKGFRLQELKNEINNLEEENRNLTTNKTSLESYGHISQRVKDLEMVAIGEEVDYITVASEVVAQR